MQPTVTRWRDAALPTEESLRARIQAEGLQAYAWENDAHDRYAGHSHDFDKVIYVVRGSITFGLPGTGRSLTLHAGDRLDLPRGTVHDATVGAQGVLCLEAHR